MRIAVSLLFLLAVLAAGLVLGGAPAIAESDTGQISIVVLDSKTKAPLDFARVVLDGPVITNELTGRDGKVTFLDVPTGIYKARIFKGGYQQVTSAQFEVLDGKQVNVDVALVKQADVKSLGTITVTSSATITSTDVSQNGPLRKLSDSLADALGKLSGVSVSTDPNGDSDASVTVSLDGHDASQTAVTLDGIPLNAPGQAANLNALNTDLFAGAGVSRGPTLGGLAGGVNFRTLEPTLTWQGSFTTSYGSYAKSSTQLTEQGSIGKLGIALTHSIRGGQSPISGDAYADASGIGPYAHAGANQSGGDLLKLRVPIGAEQTLSATLISSNNYNDVLCTTFSGPVPCGYGPGNYSDRHFSLASLNDTALIGATAVQASYYGTQSRFDRDLLARFVNGVAEPFGSTTLQSTRGASLNAQLPSRVRHTISIQANASSSSTTLVPYLAQNRVFAGGSGTTRYSSLSITDQIKSSTKLSLSERVGLSNATNSGSGILGNVSATWNPQANDQFSASLDLTGAGAAAPRVQALTDPASLRFDCASGTALGSGPGDLPGPQSSTSQRLTWQHKFATGQVTTQLYRQVQNDTLISALVGSNALGPAYFPPSYFTIANQFYQSPAGCMSATALDPSKVLIALPIGGTTRVYEGVQIASGFGLGPYVIAQTYYNVQVAKALSTDARLQGSLSTTIPGAQLPNVPLHRAGITLDAKPTRWPVELLADVNYTSANNGNNLPAYAVVDAGASVPLSRGTMTLAVTNVFNAEAGTFATPALGVPVATLQGPPLPTVGRPLAPRQVSATYTFRFGRVTQAPRLPGGNAGGFQNVLAQLPAAAADHPAAALDVQTGRQQCTQELATQVRPLLDALKAYGAAVEAAKGPNGYPEAAPANVPDVPATAVSYHKNGDSYALALTPTQPRFFRSFVSCAQLRSATLEQAQAQHLYAPPSNVFTRAAIAYAPEAGLYLVRYPQQAGQEQFRLYRLPAAPPAAPFALTDASVCTADMRPIAKKLLTSLQAYFAGYQATATADPPGWIAKGHAVAKGYWVELQPADISSLPAVLSCGHVSAATPDEIKAAGFDGARPPSLNYTPALGLYFVRGQPPQNQTRQD